MKSLITYSILLVSFLSYFSGIAQDSSSGDDYSDYSYLWDDTKEKKKKKKRKKDEVEDDQTTENSASGNPVSNQITPSDSLPQESVNEAYQVNDSTNTEENYEPSDVITPSDTLQPEETSIQSDSLQPEEKPTYSDSLETEKSKEPKPRKERGEAPPMDDFRSGIGSSAPGSFNGGFTVTQIGDQYFVGMVLNPEFSIGKVGVGLNVPILYGLEDQKIRTEIFKDGVGAARLITYIRYGVQKRDPVYVKVGQLDNTMVGFGGLINNYTNSTSFEKRKVGLHYDINYQGLVGLEGMYSDFSPGSFNLFAARPYVRPLIYSGIPIIKTLEIGSTFIRDKDQTDIITSDTTSTTYKFTRDGVGAFGIDAGVTLLRVPFIQIDLYANYSRLNLSSKALTDSLSTSTASAMSDGFKNGSGASVGMNFRFHFIANVFSTDARIERLSYSQHYLPQFFDATYEINKDAKIYSLGAAQKMSGIYGSLTGQVLQKVRIGGNLMIPDNISAETPAVVRVNADLDRLADKFSFHGSYIKGGLTDLNDAFTFDERSLAKLRVIYHLNKFLATGLDYYWAFTPTSDGSYKAERYVSPYFGLSIQF